MRTEVSSEITQVNEAKNLWEQVAPSLTPIENLQELGVDAGDISRIFDEVLYLLEGINRTEKIDPIAWMQCKSIFTSNSNAIHQFFQSHFNNPSQVIANVPIICSWLWILKSTALQLLPLDPETTNFSPDFERTISGKIVAVNGWVSQAEAYKKSILDIETSASQILKEIELRLTTVNENLQTSNSTLSAIQSIEREAGTAKTNAEAAATSSTAGYTNIKELIQSLTASVDQKDQLFKEFDDRRAEITSLLENANQVGLGRSFQLSRIRLALTLKAWAVSFFVGIIALVYIGFKEILPLLSVEDTTIDKIAISVAVRLLLVGPVVWFSWFAARQYSHALRVGEDYAFKESAAMAYSGYRNEMKSDPEMIKLLQESAIRSFSENPAKILLKKCEPTSPFHEVLDKTLDKMKPSELIGFVGDLLKNKE